jgi:multidrug efflux pump subunit AcrB
MDVVRTVNDSNLILPAGDVLIGNYDYNLYANSQLNTIGEINRLPLKTVGNATVMIADIGEAKDGAQIQTNAVHIDGQASVYLPVLKQGGDANTIAVVDGIRSAVAGLVDVPRNLIAKVVFDQSLFVKSAIENLIHEGAIGLVLTGLMILLFLANVRATLAVFLSIPLSALATFIALSLMGGTVNTMILGGLALVFSRLIDNSVVVLENIFRHLELGSPPALAAQQGGQEVALPVLAATLTTAVVFFPVTFLYGVSQFLFTALALAVVLALFASYFVAMSVVPLFCAHFIHSAKEAGPEAEAEREAEADEAGAGDGDGEWEGKARSGVGAAARARAGEHRPAAPRGFTAWFNRRFQAMVARYDQALAVALAHPLVTVLGLSGLFVLSLGLFPFIGVSYFPRTDPGQFVINIKAPTGTRIEQTDKLINQVEGIIREEVEPHDLGVLVANIGITPDFSAMYTSNSGPHTAFVQCSLAEDHHIGSYEYMERVRKRLTTDMPQLNTYFQSGGLVDAVLNLGLPAPIDIQINGTNLATTHHLATALAQEVRDLPGVSDVLVPQDVDYPAIKLDIDRVHASKLGLTSKEVVGNVITALTSDGMIAPSYWIDERTGNDYMLTVQYHENEVKNLEDLKSIPLRSADHANTTRLDAVCTLSHALSPTEVDHYQLRRVIDIYVATKGEDLGQVTGQIKRLIAKAALPDGVRINLRGMVQGMTTSFTSFGLGLILSVILVYLILVAQFRSFVDPFLILLAVPTGLTGVLIMLWATDTTLNIMSLMGVVMMVGIVVSNSILIVEFAHRQRATGLSAREAIATACRVRLRPVLMTSLATLIGTGTEAYAPLARAIVGGLAVSVVLTMFIVPAAYLMVYRRQRSTPPAADPAGRIKESDP